MLDESEVPVVERLLRVEGRASESLLDLVRGGLPPIGAGEVLLVMPFAYADLPLGKRFDVWSPDGHSGEQVDAEIAAVTQQFGKPFDGVPHGWGTLTLVRFSPDVPDSIAALPQVSDWYEHDDRAFLCTQETWRAAMGSLEPGDVAPTSGQYAVVDRDGRPTGQERKVRRGHPMPPAPEPGQQYRLVNRTNTEGR